MAGTANRTWGLGGTSPVLFLMGGMKPEKMDCWLWTTLVFIDMLGWLCALLVGQANAAEKCMTTCLGAPSVSDGYRTQQGGNSADGPWARCV
ncbi:uncharacterized protein B0I36DRAFT_329626 [Microdochium trichocladiopsis]|uniref:Uncharacterized protein n=1 Tax=Microdochium trichocladiopsis TaxID=1682393 RepID=A0A9P9BM66_9PEZI|nr:uncharacterized protein B0I36DRAFT_329626 [Microdochium trichocladiopsis]KAH7025978.1 hypothetical protein B0I36DRAFT_329626 [Microdochium trichocladiopsis]